MNHGISILFRTIPLAMAAFCFAYGAYIFAAGTDAARLTAGPVVFYLGSICIALYCTVVRIAYRNEFPRALHSGCWDIKFLKFSIKCVPRRGGEPSN